MGMCFEFDRDYIFIYGPEWANELEDCLRRDPLAVRTMARLNLTFDDIRHYYLNKQHFEQVRDYVLDYADKVLDPVELLLTTIDFRKREANRRIG